MMYDGEDDGKDDDGDGGGAEDSDVDATAVHCPARNTQGTWCDWKGTAGTETTRRSGA